MCQPVVSTLSLSHALPQRPCLAGIFFNVHALRLYAIQAKIVPPDLVTTLEAAKMILKCRARTLARRP